MAEATPIRLHWTRLCQIGARATNQDALGQANDQRHACFVLADGAGGHAGGEVASNTVVNCVLGAFKAAPGGGATVLRSYCQHAIGVLADAQQQDARHKDMSTTLCAVLIDCASGDAHWLHLGDSRIYLFRAGRLLSVTKDHSVTQQFIDAGLAQAGQLRQHAQRNLLFAAVGAQGDTPLAEHGVTLLPGDALLLCSDGLWEWVLEAQMEATLAGAADSGAWMQAMCDIADAATGATAAGGAKARDNYSAYAILVEAA